MPTKVLSSVVLTLLLVACASAPHAEFAPRPREIFVASANPHATEAGLAVLRRGGSAVDAAVAVEVMLGLVEPQSSGVGGGGFMMHYDADTARVTAYNGRETAPAAAHPTMFLDVNGKPLPRRKAMLTGRATGVPGVMAMLKMVHEAHGHLPWSALFADAILLARQGFAVSPRLAEHIHGNFPQAQAEDVRRYFSRPDGTQMQAGDVLRNPVYAAFLERLAAEGPDALHRGETATRMVERTRERPLGGTMTLADLANYRAERIEALCRPYRVWILCAPAPPASGGGLLYLMGVLSRTDVDRRGPGDPQAWFLFAEASRVMYADRDHYFGDPRFVSVPVKALLDPRYLDDRARHIGERAAASYAPGTPPHAPARAPDATAEPPGTTHFVIVDADGNAVSMTATIESFFGSGRMVDGFFLNNELTDFSFTSVNKDGTPAANAVAGGKRPRSSMTPTIILNADGTFAGVVGSPGGNAIPAYVAKTLVGVLDWGLTMQEAIELPNLVARGEAFNGEAHKFPRAVIDGLKQRGIEVKRGSGETSGLHGVFVTPRGLDGGADPRREGTARALAVP
jgi:gamma-glutamyltranspeptidase/glutathione hydrolase